MREEDRAGMGVTQQTFRQNLPYMRPSARSGSVTSVTQMCQGCLHITFTYALHYPPPKTHGAQASPSPLLSSWEK